MATSPTINQLDNVENEVETILTSFDTTPGTTAR